MRQSEKSITSLLSVVKKRSQGAKRAFSLNTLKMLLVLQIKTQDHLTWSVESLNLASYRMFRDKGQRSRRPQGKIIGQY